MPEGEQRYLPPLKTPSIILRALKLPTREIEPTITCSLDEAMSRSLHTKNRAISPDIAAIDTSTYDEARQTLMEKTNIEGVEYGRNITLDSSNTVTLHEAVRGEAEEWKGGNIFPNNEVKIADEHVHPWDSYPSFADILGFMEGGRRIMTQIDIIEGRTQEKKDIKSGYPGRSFYIFRGRLTPSLTERRIFNLWNKLWLQHNSVSLNYTREQQKTLTFDSMRSVYFEDMFWQLVDKFDLRIFILEPGSTIAKLQRENSHRFHLETKQQ